MKLVLASFLAWLPILFACPTVRADAPPPEALDCWDKKVGDACTEYSTNAAGVCEDGTCTTTKPDAAPTSYACRICTPGAPPADDGACAIGTHGAVRRVGPWCLAGLFSLLFLIGRRRRR